MDIYHTIIRPLVTEKSSQQAAEGDERRGGAYAFEVHPKAKKAEIRDAVEKIYGVKVVSIRTQNKKGKLRRYRHNYAVVGAMKKAVVVLDRNSHIDLF
jgi:large subunit ribosomal protein L23